MSDKIITYNSATGEKILKDFLTYLNSLTEAGENISIDIIDGKLVISGEGGGGDSIGITLDDKYLSGVKSRIEPDEFVHVPLNYEYNCFELDIEGDMDVEGTINIIGCCGTGDSFSGDYNDLTNLPDIPDGLPTGTSGQTLHFNADNELVANDRLLVNIDDTVIVQPIFGNIDFTIRRAFGDSEMLYIDGENNRIHLGHYQNSDVYARGIKAPTSQEYNVVIDDSGKLSSKEKPTIPAQKDIQCKHLGVEFPLFKTENQDPLPELMMIGNPDWYIHLEQGRKYHVEVDILIGNIAEGTDVQLVLAGETDWTDKNFIVDINGNLMFVVPLIYNGLVAVYQMGALPITVRGMDNAHPYQRIRYSGIIEATDAYGDFYILGKIANVDSGAYAINISPRSYIKVTEC